MKPLITLIFLLVSVSPLWGQCGKLVINPTTGRLDCTGSSEVTPYEASFTGATSLSVNAATHAQGVNVTGVCFDNATPRNTITQTANYPQVSAAGQIDFAWTGSKTGACYIWSMKGTQGPTGATGATGPAGAGFNGRGTYAQMTASSPSTNDVWQLTDASAAGSCSAGGGTAKAMCVWSGSAWVVSSGSGSGTPGGTNAQIQYNDNGSFGGLDRQGNGTKVQMSSAPSNPDQYTIAVYDANGNLLGNAYNCKISATGFTCGDGTAAGEYEFAELAANGTEKITIKGPDSRATTVRLELPAADPSAGQVPSWGAPSGGIATGSWVTPQLLDAALTALAAGSDFVRFVGPTTTVKEFTLPDANGTLATAAATLTSGQLVVGGNGAAVNVGNLSGDVTTSGGTVTTLGSNFKISSFGITIDGGGSAITTGVKGYAIVPYACTIAAWSLVADQSGSIVVDIWKRAGTDDAVPTVAHTITASAKPTLSTDQIVVNNSTLTGWTTSVSANDVIGFNVDSATTVQRVTLTVKCTR